MRRAKQHRVHPFACTAVEKDPLHGLRCRRPHAEYAATSRLNDGGLLPSYGFERIAEDARMVQTDAAHRHGTYALHRRRGIPATTHAHLKYRHVHICLGIHHERGHRQQVKLGDVVGPFPRGTPPLVHATSRLEGHAHAVGELHLAYGSSVDLHALGIAHEFGAGIERSAQAFALQYSRRIP